jgi:DNA-binding XRE family transcriptional regulator
MAIRGITQVDIAKTLGYSKQSVNAWFTGKVEPRLTLTEWKKLAELMGTTVDRLPNSFSPQPIHDIASSSSHI